MIKKKVTNFESAHDTDGTMVIDSYVSDDISELKNFSNDDSIWNFHVWNEVFVRGKGHWPEKYAGWAADDATPQVKIRVIF